MLNVRLNKELEKKLNSYSKQNHITKSDVVKEALALYLTKEQSAQSPFEAGEDLFGTEGSGNTKASVSYKQSIKQKLREKHSH
ncbi:MAG: hypothetical protein ABJ004_18390 [Cyclobacteriaceae bacterium]